MLSPKASVTGRQFCSERSGELPLGFVLPK